MQKKFGTWGFNFKFYAITYVFNIVPIYPEMTNIKDEQNTSRYVRHISEYPDSLSNSRGLLMITCTEDF
jgi:hypothetical protein